MYLLPFTEWKWCLHLSVVRVITLINAFEFCVLYLALVSVLRRWWEPGEAAAYCLVWTSYLYAIQEGRDTLLPWQTQWECILNQAWKWVRGEKGEKDITPLGGSGSMLPRKKNLNIPYFKASIYCILRCFFCQPGESWRNLTSAMSQKWLWPPY